MKTSTKVWTILVTIIVLSLAGFIYFKWFFVPQEGVDAGLLNYCNYEGVIFKTNEGKLIQAGYNSQNSSATIQSNEFKFSVETDELAELLREKYTGQQVKLSWKRYNGTLPWRGNSQYIVIGIVGDNSLDSTPATPQPVSIATGEPTDDVLNLPVN